MPVDAKGEGLLLDAFHPASYQEWRREAEKLLDRGRSFDEALVTRTHEGIDLQPIYSQEDLDRVGATDRFPGIGARARGRSASGPVLGGWEVAQELGLTSIAELNRALREDVERGQTGVAFRLDAAARGGSRLGPWAERGVAVGSADDLAALLDELDLERLTVNIDGGGSAVACAALLAAVAERRGLTAARLRGCVGLDPLGVLAAEGTFPIPLDDSYDEMAPLADWAARSAPGLSVIGVGTEPYHQAGANAVQELAFAAATGVEYLRALGERNLLPARVAPLVQLSFEVGTHFFMELAKLRAVRMVWAQILAELGVPEEARGVRIRARTSTLSVTVGAPHVNVLRATTEAIAAILGGCDSLHVGSVGSLGSDVQAIRPPDERSRRLARNTQLVLRDEAHLGAVIDPAGGSWLVESLTRTLAERAWGLFQRIEALGGMAAALRSGHVQREVKAVAAERLKDLAKRKDVLLGTSADVAPGAAAPEPARRVEQGRAASGGEGAVEGVVQGGVQGGAPDQPSFDDLLRAAARGATLEQLDRMLRPVALERPAVEPLVRLRSAESFEAPEGRPGTDAPADLQEGATKAGGAP